jgi:hypothetical protein
MHILVALILGVMLLASPVHADMSVAGFIKTLEGSGEVLRGNAALPASVGDVLQVGDTVTTGEQSTLGIMLEDDTTLSMGPNSRLELNDFAFAPKDELFSIAVRLLKGSFAYMSGVIGRLAPDKVRIETPDAVIAIHGTHFVVKAEEKP